MKIGLIVEGFNDEALILSVFPDAGIVVTRGTRFDNRVRMDIDALLPKSDVIFILVDPDPAGDLLARAIQHEYPFDRIVVDPLESICYRNKKKKIGVEHCSPEYIGQILTDAIAGHLSSQEGKVDPHETEDIRRTETGPSLPF